MTDKGREHIRNWMRDAYAMEEQAERLFGAQSEHMNDFPNVQDRLLLEINYAREHQTMLSVRIQQLGSAPSLLKDMGAKLFAGFQSLIEIVMDNQPVKSILEIHTFTHFAIGSYRILIVAALEVNDEETLNVCKTILNQTQLRALWIEDQVAIITKRSMEAI